MIPNEAEWIVWMIGGLCAFFTIAGGLMCMSSDRESKEAGQKLLAGWWGAVVTILATTLLMTFVVKPVLAWFFGLF
jgi:hypothetical protein